MLNNLIARTVRWSLGQEIGSGPGADGGRPAFQAAARGAVRGAGGQAYMQEKIRAELDLPPPYLPGTAPHRSYRNRESMGWSVSVRRDYINRLGCDLAMTVHLNAGGLGPTGTVMLVTDNGAPTEQVRAAKLMLKYVDPLDQGNRASGGVSDDEAGLLTAGNQHRDKYVYFELEYMTSTVQANPGVRDGDANRYQYQNMVSDRFVNRVAEQIAAGVVEFLFDPQDDIDQVTFNGAFANW